MPLAHCCRVGFVTRATTAKRQCPRLGVDSFLLEFWRPQGLHFGRHARKFQTLASGPEGEATPQVEEIEAAASSDYASPPAASTASTSVSEDSGPNNGILAGGAVAVGVALFLATRLLGGGVTFDDLEAGAVPLDVALSNGKPTIVEFYANWCELCRDMLPEMLDAEKEYDGKINFVALNVENTKWAPEMLEYNVDGIPHYVFLDADQRPQAVGVGRLPKKVLEADLQALSEGAPLPYTKAVYQSSAVDAEDPGSMAGPKKDVMPRDHA